MFCNHFILLTLRWNKIVTSAAALVVLASFLNAAEPDDKWFTQDPTVAESRVREKPQQPVTSKVEKDKPQTSEASKGPAPNWIWGSEKIAGNETYYLRKKFEGGSKSASLIASCDNVMTVYINGKQVASGSSWADPITVDVQKHIQKGSNELLVQATNEGGPAGFILRLAMTMPDDKLQYVLSDKSWEAAKTKDADQWTAVHTIGKLGSGPWGDVFSNPTKSLLPQGPRNVFNVLPGFQVELLYTVPKNTQGSWVSIAFDNKGRLLASDQGNQGIYRVTPPAIGSEEPTKVEKLDFEMSSAHGMLYAFDSLYISVNGGRGSGLYRARDTNGDDQFDEVELLKSIRGGGEHGPHAVRLSPDGKSLYWIAGNHTDPPENFDASRVPSNWGEDLLLPRQWDARGHARGRLAPGGWIAKTDPDGKTWEIISIGYRNPYDMDFNADGELFAYDADMEWDLGSPWYRPTRVVHATSGSEFGWRSGTGKWPTYYVDSLPQLVDIGPGSPVGVAFGYGTKFPTKYQNALYILDWTFGTIYAIHNEAEGASYTAVKEEFLSRTPLPLTDVTVGPDGALYFTVGGRGTQSELFRVTYIGEESTSPAVSKDERFASTRALRRKLEQLQVKSDKGLETIWPHLGHEDRHIRFAARTALEHQDVKLWQDRALMESDPQTLISATVALARQGDASLEPSIISALSKIDYKQLSEQQQLDLLRAYQLVFIRLGQPNQETAESVAMRLDEFYPATGDALNRELSTLLVYLNSPTVITKTIALMEKETEQSAEDMLELLARNSGYGGTIAKMLANQPELQKIHYAFVLRNMRFGWTLDQRKAYFKWFNSALERSGGASYQGFINNIREEALANVSPAERKALESTTIAPPPKLSELPKPKGPGRKWTVSDVTQSALDQLAGRDFENGKKMYAAARCAACHRFDGDGGATGPDLSNVAGRFSVRDLAESIIEPGKIVSDQYKASVIVTDQGKVINGRVVGEANGKLTVMTDPYDATKIVEVTKASIEEIKPAPVSLMPNDLLNELNETEVLNLAAYLLSRGNPEDRMFGRSE